MALISTTTTSSDGTPSGEFVADAFTSVNLRTSHTIMCRVKNGSTATNYHSVAFAYIDDAELTGSIVGRTSGQAGTGLNWSRQAGFFSGYSRNTALRSTCYGNTTDWYHLAFVYNSTTAQIRAYIDGVYIGQTASATGNTDSSTGNQFIVGAHNGKFADAALFNRALSDSEVADMAAYRVPQVTSGLVLFWRLDSDATDSSGNGNNGAESGGTPAVSWSTSDNPPQPETPAINITASASASTAGAATVTKINGLGACTGSASTSGTASVSLSNVAASGPARGVGWADVMPRNGAEGWRFPPMAGLNVAGSNGAATGGVSQRTYMCWIRYYVDTSVTFTGLGTAYVYVRGTGGTTWRMQLFVTPGPNPIFQSSLLSGGSTIATRTSTAQSSAWHHVAAVYDGSVFKFYLDGVQVGTDATVSLPADDTATSIAFNSTAGAQTPVDVAHMKFWVGSALSSGQIATEMANYRPVTDVANVRGYWPMAWDNPTWDAWSNTMTLSGSIVHSGDDAPNGPSGSWPPIGSVTGSTQTSGSASVQRVLALGACTGATSTAGAAAVSATFAYAVAGTGATSTSGAAQLNRVYSVASTGSAQTSGAATVGREQVFSISATANPTTTGSAALSASASAASSASTQTTGSASVGAAAAVAATGATSGGGSAALTAGASAAASSSTSTAGTATVGNVAALAGAGSTSTSGAATVTAAADIAAAGSTQTTGFAATAGTLVGLGETSTVGTTSFATASFPVTVTGESATSGAADVSGGFPLAAAATTSSSGTATLTASAQIVASGASSTSGATVFTMRATAGSQTTGTATLGALAGLVAAAQTSTSGTAAIGIGISASGSSSSAGSAALSAAAALAATGSTLGFGSAVFDGVAPVGGGGGGVPTSRRMLGALGTRRRIR